MDINQLVEEGTRKILPPPSSKQLLNGVSMVQKLSILRSSSPRCVEFRLLLLFSPAFCEVVIDIVLFHGFLFVDELQV
jgi:hypothetical protein